MRYLKIVIAIISVFFIISCKSNDSERLNSFKGNWYRYHFSSVQMDTSNYKSKIDFSYEEIFINDSIIFSCLNSAGYISPTYYYMKKDSFFSSFGLSDKDNFTYKGRLKKLSNNHFIFFSDSDSINYYRLTNEPEVLSNYINKNFHKALRYKDLNGSFSQAFINRSENCYLKNK